MTDPERDEAAALQSYLSEAIRSVEPEEAKLACDLLLRHPPRPGVDWIRELFLAGLAAAATDSRIWNALAQVRQVNILNDETKSTEETND